MKVRAATREAYKLLHDGSLALARMEANGIRVDERYLDAKLAETADTIRELTEELKRHELFRVWKRIYGSYRTKLGAKEQLANVLHKEGIYKPSEVTATGRIKADEEALMRVDHPFVKSYYELAHLKDVRSKYLMGIKQETVGGFIHPFFHLHTVVTFRGSSSQINIQNIPNRDTNMGQLVRRCFIPRGGNHLSEVDFGTLEWNLAACFWRDQEMIRYASDPSRDVHRDTAAELFMCSTEEVSKGMRQAAKNQFVFPVLYGSYFTKCAAGIWDYCKNLNVKFKDDKTLVLDHLERKGITELGRCDSNAHYDPKKGSYEHHTKQVEANFNKRFPEFGRGKERWWEAYQKTGSFRMMTGFVASGIYSRNFLLNAPIQGPGFHCLLWSLVRTQKYLDRHKMKSLLVAEIHDCMLGDNPPDELQEFLGVTRRIMTEDLPKAWDWIVVPMKAEVDVAEVNQSWFDKQPWQCDNGVWRKK